MTSMTLTAGSAGSPPEGNRQQVKSGSGSCRTKQRGTSVVVAGLTLSLFSSLAHGQTAPVAPPPAPTVPVQPLPTTEPTAPAAVGPEVTTPSLATAPDPYLAQPGATGAALDAPPPPDEPIYEKWWFWTGIGALAVVGVVVAVSVSGQKTPSTYFGNGRAF